MRKLNHSGFMLAEVIIVSTVVLGTLVGLYSIFSKMYVVYTERSYYNNVDTVYTLKNIYKNLIDNNEMNSLINNGLQEDEKIYDNKKNYIELVNNSTCGNGYIDEEFCIELKNTYGIRKVLFVRYDENSFTNVNVDVEGNNQSDNLFTFYNGDLIVDYFDYLSDSMDFSEDFQYMFIVELVDGDYHYYGNYRIR